MTTTPINGNDSLEVGRVLDPLSVRTPSVQMVGSRDPSHSCGSVTSQRNFNTMKNPRLLILATLALGLSLALPCASAQSAAPPAQPSAEKKPTPKGPAKPYPLKVCIVTDNDLDSMGDETSIVYEGQTIKFCCAPCEKKFLKNPARYLAKFAPKAPEKK